MNILITSSGRRTSLLKFFRVAAHKRGGKVFAGDLDSLAPTLFGADGAFRLPPIMSADYVSVLEELIEKHRINLVVPTIDTELLVLARNRPRLEQASANILISDIHLVECARDKWKTHELFVRHGIRMPRTWLPEELDRADLPERVFLKPRDGSSSLNTHAVRRQDVSNILPSVPCPIIQECVSGTEITIDALLSLDGEPIHYVPRIRLKAIGGESVQGVTIDNATFAPWMGRLLGVLQSLGGRGPMTLQAFLVPDGDPIFFEVNPRFGGGFPLGHAAGGEYPEWICRMLEGEMMPSKLGMYERGLYMTRYYEEIVTKELPWPR